MLRRRPIVLAAVPLAIALVLAGCGGQAPTTAPSSGASSAAPSSPPSSAASTTAPEPSESASSSPTESTASQIMDPCEVIPSADMEKFVNADLGKAKASSDDESKTCEYAATASGGTIVYTIVGRQTRSLKSDLSSIEKKAKVTEVDVEGFEEAYSLRGSKSGATIAGVAVKRGDLAYLAAVAGTKSFDTYESYCEQIVTALAS